MFNSLTKHIHKTKSYRTRVFQTLPYINSSYINTEVANITPNISSNIESFFLPIKSKPNNVNTDTKISGFIPIFALKGLLRPSNLLRVTLRAAFIRRFLPKVVIKYLPLWIGLYSFDIIIGILTIVVIAMAMLGIEGLTTSILSLTGITISDLNISDPSVIKPEWMTACYKAIRLTIGICVISVSFTFSMISFSHIGEFISQLGRDSTAYDFIATIISYPLWCIGKATTDTIRVVSFLGDSLFGILPIDSISNWLVWIIWTIIGL